MPAINRSHVRSASLKGELLGGEFRQGNGGLNGAAIRPLPLSCRLGWRLDRPGVDPVMQVWLRIERGGLEPGRPKEGYQVRLGEFRFIGSAFAAWCSLFKLSDGHYNLAWNRKNPTRKKGEPDTAE